jgi:hypothetical protein
MVDTWATVGSCAQIGKNVHLSGGVGIGGVLEPVQAAPTIIEDNCFIGARSEVVEGVIVEEGSVISMGVYIGQSTRIYDREKDEITMRAAMEWLPAVNWARYGSEDLSSTMEWYETKAVVRSLEGSPVVATAPGDDRSIHALRAALVGTASQAPAGTSEDRRRPRLWIDRSFRLRGTGRVVTGTLAGGRLAVGDDVVVYVAESRGHDVITFREFHHEARERTHRKVRIKPPSGAIGNPLTEVVGN